MSGYWFEDPANPFNQMSWTRGGGGYDNSLTADSNARRAEAMPGVDGLPRFATAGIAQSVLGSDQYAVVGDHIIKTSGPGVAGVGTSSQGGGTGAGSAGVQAGPQGGGSRSGSQLAIGHGQGFWWEEAGQASVPAGSWVETAELPMLQPVAKGTNTALMLWGKPFVPHPGTSDAEEIEALMGEGDHPTEIAWWFKQAANVAHVTHNVGLVLADNYRTWATNEHGQREEQPRFHNGWVTYDEGASWEFTRNGDPHLWDSPEKPLGGSPWAPFVDWPQR